MHVYPWVSLFDMGDQQAGAIRMPFGPCDAARMARLAVSTGSGVVIVYISQGLAVMRSQCDSEQSYAVHPDFGRSHDRSGILLRIVPSGAPLVWADWRRWYEHLATTWGSALVDVLVVSPARWRSLLAPDAQETSEPRRA